MHAVSPQLVQFVTTEVNANLHCLPMLQAVIRLMQARVKPTCSHTQSYAGTLRRAVIQRLHSCPLSTADRQLEPACGDVTKPAVSDNHAIGVTTTRWEKQPRDGSDNHMKGYHRAYMPPTPGHARLSRDRP